MIRTAFGSRRALGLTGAALAILALTGCDDSPAFLKSVDAAAASGDAATNSTKLVEQDVEAPEVFEATEAALWDGRPSLGGVWVAHPDVTDPQRVLIRNTANNKEVIGALFRRERDIPGPRIQASSDAAEALAMLAGAPVQLSVTALVRTEAAPEPETQDSAPESSTGTETVAVATAGIEAATPTDSPEAEPVLSADPKPKKGFRWPWSKPDPVPVAAATAMVAAPAAIVSEPLVQQTPPLNKPYIQIGIFSVEENADRAATQMRAAGLTPTVYEQSSDDKKFWRVVVGPAQTTAQRSALLKSVEGTGFSDAYFVTN
ncbi:SPOR domain-containing protein [Sedimentitalea nanhaiensis]|uniref:Sporulation related domain-containing protein n=1 Tax=Sedimentitalea nanhaiensis TaxID=999627 RepID=A0A1I6YLF7_9RHOB|nr:SPOR domain-containing protein [Sedimentitalea nanhaiensis]SFT51329.1 Sporulation related domain-containing protein [Sedimentitalea nanhaiensis]